MEAKEKTFRKWLKEKHGNQQLNNYSGTEAEELAIQYLLSYKASLREAIKKRKEFVQECTPPDAHYDARKIGGLYEIDKVLELIDTVNPKN